MSQIISGQFFDSTDRLFLDSTGGQFLDSTGGQCSVFTVAVVNTAIAMAIAQPFPPC